MIDNMIRNMIPEPHKPAGLTPTQMFSESQPETLTQVTVGDASAVSVGDASNVTAGDGSGSGSAIDLTVDTVVVPATRKST